MWEKSLWDTAKEEDESKIKEVGSAITLESQEVYQSNYLQVQGYRQVAFYVGPGVSVINEIAQPVVLTYQLDAYFSLEGSLTGVKDFESNKTKYLRPGWKEFGYQQDEGGAERPFFVKTTTGETTSRVLVVPVYAPYARVELKNLTPGEPRKFKITAYLMR